MKPGESIRLPVTDAAKTIGFVTGKTIEVNPVWCRLWLNWHPFGGKPEIITEDRPVKSAKIRTAIQNCTLFIDGIVDTEGIFPDIQQVKPPEPSVKQPPEPYGWTVKGLEVIHKNWQDMNAEERKIKMRHVRLGWERWWASLPKSEQKRRIKRRGHKSHLTWKNMSEENKRKFREGCRQRALKHWASLNPEERKIRAKNIGRKRKPVARGSRQWMTSA